MTTAPRSTLKNVLESNTSSFGLFGQSLDNEQNDVKYLEDKLHELILRELNLENRLHDLQADNAFLFKWVLFLFVLVLNLVLQRLCMYFL